MPRQPFYAQSLELALESATREFFQHPRKFQLDAARQRVRLSAILDFYTDDFVATGSAQDLPEYVNNYLDTPIPQGYRVEFFDYDWSVNAQ